MGPAPAQVEQPEHNIAIRDRQPDIAVLAPLSGFTGNITSAFEPPLPQPRPAMANECEYDQRHRLLLSNRAREQLGPECIEAPAGYPTVPPRGLRAWMQQIRKRAAAEHELVASLAKAEDAEFDQLVRN